MPGLHDTAYPRFKKRIHRKVLEQIYTPTREEIILARNEARGEAAVLCYLILLKTFQRLGYFVRLKQVPTKIIYHIAGHLGYETLPDLSYYDGSKTRFRHLARIRSYLNITAFGEESIAIIESAIAEACQVMDFRSM